MSLLSRRSDNTTAGVVSPRSASDMGRIRIDRMRPAPEWIDASEGVALPVRRNRTSGVRSTCRRTRSHAEGRGDRSVSARPGFVASVRRRWQTTTAAPVGQNGFNYVLAVPGGTSASIVPAAACVASAPCADGLKVERTGRPLRRRRHVPWPRGKAKEAGQEVERRPFPPPNAANRAAADRAIRPWKQPRRPRPVAVGTHRRHRGTVEEWYAARPPRDCLRDRDRAGPPRPKPVRARRSRPGC